MNQTEPTPFEASVELDELLARPPLRNIVSGFLEGALTPIRGVSYLRRHPDLWRYAILPVLVNLLITTLVLLAVIFTVGWTISYLHGWLVGDQSGAWRWGAILLELAIGTLMLLICGLVGVVTWKVLSGILCGHFYGVLCRQVELRLGVDASQFREISFLYGILDTIYDLLLLLVVNGLFMLLNVIPVLGSLLALLGTGTFTGLVVGLDFLGIPLAMRGYRRLDQFRFGIRNLGCTTGIGAVVFVMQLIPILGAVLLTATAVGTVLLHRRLEHAEQQQQARLQNDEVPEAN